ncbi:hypothetical protein Tcan_03209, partial [Toxocara canis]
HCIAQRSCRTVCISCFVRVGVVLRGMSSALIADPSSSSAKKTEEGSAESATAQSHPGSGSARREINIRKFISAECARPYEPPRWKSFRLPAAKYELLIYAELLIAAMVIVALKEVAIVPWSKVERLNAAIKKLNPAQLTMDDAILLASKLLNATSEEPPCALLRIPPKITEKCAVEHSEFEYAPLSRPSLFPKGLLKGSDLRRAYQMTCCNGYLSSRFCPCGYELIEEHCIALVRIPSAELLKSIKRRPCGDFGQVASFESTMTISTLQQLSAHFNKCAVEHSEFEYAPLSRPSLFPKGLLKGSDLRRAYQMTCCNGYLSSRELLKSIKRRPCGDFGQVASFESTMTISTLQQLSAHFNVIIYLDVAYSCATKTASKISDSSPIPFNSFLMSRCHTNSTKDFEYFTIEADSVREKSPNNSWILCVAQRNEGSEWWLPDLDG